MTIRFMEGFETATEGECYERKWAAFDHPGSFSAGRLHGSAIGVSSSSSINTEYRTRALGLQNTWTVGFGLQYDNATVTDRTEVWPLVVKRGSSEQIRFQWRKGVGNTFHFDIFRGATLLGTTPDYVALSWHYFEIEMTLDPTNGSIEFRHNTQVDLDLAGPINTADTGLAGADVFEINTKQFGPAKFDDLYCLDDQGSINNTFLGDSVIEGRLPNADATPLDWNLENGGFGSIDEHWEAIADLTCVGTVGNSYIWSDTVSDQDMFAFAALSFITGQIHAVMVSSDVRLDTTGSRQFKHIIRSNGTLYTSPAGGISHTVASTDFQAFFDVFELDPDTSSKWTIGDLNAAEFGVEVVS